MTGRGVGIWVMLEIEAEIRTEGQVVGLEVISGSEKWRGKEKDVSRGVCSWAEDCSGLLGHTPMLLPRREEAGTFTPFSSFLFKRLLQGHHLATARQARKDLSRDFHGTLVGKLSLRWAGSAGIVDGLPVVLLQHENTCWWYYLRLALLAGQLPKNLIWVLFDILVRLWHKPYFPISTTRKSSDSLCAIFSSFFLKHIYKMATKAPLS